MGKAKWRRTRASALQPQQLFFILFASKPSCDKNLFFRISSFEETRISVASSAICGENPKALF
jgi:hypothetical protein